MGNTNFKDSSKKLEFKNFTELANTEISDITFEELFKDYHDGPFDTQISLPDERQGNEKW